MAYDAHANFATTTVATPPSPASSGTSLVVAAGAGALFPAVPFNATVWPSAASPTSVNSEIVRVTARTTDTLTITRAQEGTSAQSITTAYSIAATVTAKTLTDIEAKVPIVRTYSVDSSSDLISFSTEATVTGATITTVTVTGSSATIMAWGTFDFLTNAAVTFTGRLQWNGSDRAEQAVMISPTSATTFRSTTGQSWQITGVTAGTYTATLMATCSASSTTNEVKATHTGLRILVLDTTN